MKFSLFSPYLVKPYLAKAMINKAIKAKGFSLIELLVVLSIISLLFTLGSHSYVRHIQKSKLLQAKLDLLVFASRMEQYKLFNLNYFGAAGTQTSPENTGVPWIFEAHSPANKPVQERVFNLTIYSVSDSGLQYQIMATPYFQDGENKDVKYGSLVYYSDGRRGHDINKDGYFTENEMCWDCL